MADLVPVHTLPWDEGLPDDTLFGIEDDERVQSEHALRSSLAHSRHPNQPNLLRHHAERVQVLSLRNSVRNEPRLPFWFVV